MDAGRLAGSKSGIEMPMVRMLRNLQHSIAEDTMRKSREYAEGGIDQYWIVDPELRRVDVFGNVEGEWELLLHLDEATPAGAVTVGEHGTLTVELNAASRCWQSIGCTR